MSRSIIPKNNGQLFESYSGEIASAGDKRRPPSINELEAQLAQSSRLVNDIVLKKYLHDLTELEVIPLDDKLKNIDFIRLFKITEMVYQKDEYSTYKFASVFGSLQNLNCGVFILVDSDGEKTDFYMGVRSLDEKRTTKSLKDTLKNALIGQFPGAKTEDLLNIEAKELLDEIPSKNIASVSGVANNKDRDFKNNETFIQGLEKLALAMQGQKFTAIVLANSTPQEQIDDIRSSYETIYTGLSPFANMQLSYGTNTALSISDAYSNGTTVGTSYTRNTSVSKGTSYSKGTSDTYSVSKPSALGTALKIAGIAALSLIAIPVTGGASAAAGAAAITGAAAGTAAITGATVTGATVGAAAITSAAAGTAAITGATVGAVALSAGHSAISSVQPPTKTKSHTTSETYTENETRTEGNAFTESESKTESITNTRGMTSGTSDTTQLTMQNKTLLNTLERIDMQLKRLNECESLGMWECAAYFLSDSQETAEMAAGTYKAIMKGENSGVETSAINYWNHKDTAKLSALREYITNFIHPVFDYSTEQENLPVTAASLLSSNELAIQMGLPRKSVCGFPVTEHADFGKEVVSYNKHTNQRKFCLGKIFTMGTKTDTDVDLDINSLTMHTFVTGSTGSGKSNTVYEILNRLHGLYSVPFLVIEPAKGEYKNLFGQFSDVSVYGTNFKKTQLLNINPFSFPDDVHVLEHLDRLVEIFNVCWPMYAAMPAILKDGIERAYKAIGWDLTKSENENGRKFPNFSDVFEQIQTVIDESKYSADSKGDYSGALLTRVRSLTTGLNALIFCNNGCKETSDEDLFDKSVIVDLSRVGSTETKSLIMGLLVMKLNEYRMSSGKINSALSHITVLEEAHNLLKRTSAEQSYEGANLLGKSVELLANSIAEMRTYGEGFIIADQSPGLLDMSVIRNTNTKIVLRLPDRGDRELVGYAAGLKNDEQIEELAKLKQGVATVYQNDWIEPVLVQINKCELVETPYDYTAPPSDSSDASKEDILDQVINLFIQGQVKEKLDFSVSEIESRLETLGLSVEKIDFIKEQIIDYKEHESLELWSNDKFEQLSRLLAKILNVREEVASRVADAGDNKELSDELEKIVKRFSPKASRAKINAMSKCFMNDMSTQQDDSEIRQKIYFNWLSYCKKRGIKT